MAKVQNFKRLNAEDYDSKDRDLITKLSGSINPFADDINNAFSNALSIEDNFNINKKDVTFSIDKNSKIIGSPKIATGLNHSCDGITVIKVTNLSNATVYPTGTPFVSFTESAGIISINNITNLPGNCKYTIKLLLY